MTAATVDVAAWIGDADTVGIRDTDGAFYVVGSDAYRAERARVAYGAPVPVPVAAVRVPFDPFIAAEASTEAGAR